ncbi:MAG: hypothetical protein LQ351_005956 [Letrouitia transgressa]|nr:MAG: hypothetical protein LQ351_005956 [Letrouitia transgressa]
MATGTSRKRSLTEFFSPVQKRACISPPVADEPSIPDEQTRSNHSTYPFPVPYFPSYISDQLLEVPASDGRAINDQPDLDLLYFQPYIPKAISKDLFNFLRTRLFFYRVQYKIKRGAIETQINTPRYTTVFGVDESSRFSSSGDLLEASSSKPVSPNKYPTCNPRPLPHCLDELRRITEVLTDSTYNFCLVNYYATGSDSISYHSDDERFLGPRPSIASFSLGAQRDFLLKHKPVPPSDDDPRSLAINQAKPLKLALGSGDMVLMRGSTQANWLHSIPKRKGRESEKGRINITFRKAMVKGGTENYYQYNVGDGGVWRWDERSKEMKPWKSPGGT